MSGGFEQRQQRRRATTSERPSGSDLAPASAARRRRGRAIAGSRSGSCQRTASGAHARALPRDSPSRPVGRNSRTRTSSDERDDVLPLGAEDRRAVVLDEAEQKPAEQRAAQVADAAEHGGGEGLDAEEEADVVAGRARSASGTASPPHRPSAPPRGRSAWMTRSMLTPISAAVSGSWATARMPRPSRDRRTNWSSATIIDERRR